MSKESKEDQLQLIADEKSQDALSKEADQHAWGKDEFFAKEDGICAGLRGTGKVMFSVYYRRKPGARFHVTYESTIRLPNGKQINALVKYSRKHKFHRGMDTTALKNHLGGMACRACPRAIVGFCRCDDSQAEQVKKDLKEMGLKNVDIRPDDDNWEECDHYFFIDTSFENIKKRLESLPERKKKDA